MCPLALISHASYLVLVHRLTDLLRTSFPRSVALAQLCFTSFAVVSSREDLHLQDCTHAGHTLPPLPCKRGLTRRLVKLGALGVIPTTEIILNLSRWLSAFQLVASGPIIQARSSLLLQNPANYSNQVLPAQTLTLANPRPNDRPTPNRTIWLIAHQESPQPNGPHRPR